MNFVDFYGIFRDFYGIFMGYILILRIIMDNYSKNQHFHSKNTVKTPFS
jgi:hypothetical protein